MIRNPGLAKKFGNYSAACGTPEAAREPVSAFAGLWPGASMPHGERPGIMLWLNSQGICMEKQFTLK
jgi:hypothetical protein